MNAGIDQTQPLFEYYDADYPSKETNPYPENFDAITKEQGIAFDTQRYKEIAEATGGPLLELCCGTGRVGIELAKAGFEITGVDISGKFLEQFRRKCSSKDADLRQRIHLVEQDVTCLELDTREYRMAFIAFNSLLCIPDFRAQCETLRRVSAHLSASGILVIDIVNPSMLPITGTTTPNLFYTRRNPNTGNVFSRFSLAGPFDSNQKQELYGWYDEVDQEGRVTRKYYSQYWRPIYRFEIELMLQLAGLEIISIEGGHKKEDFSASSPRMFIQARNASRSAGQQR